MLTRSRSFLCSRRERMTWQGCRVMQPVASGIAVEPDRDAGQFERLQVTMDRSRGTLQFGRECLNIWWRSIGDPAVQRERSSDSAGLSQSAVGIGWGSVWSRGQCRTAPGVMDFSAG